MQRLTIPAEIDRLGEVQDFITAFLEDLGCPMKALLQIQMAAEEIFVNIAHYAYAPGRGSATVECEALGDGPAGVAVRFIDAGTPYNPLGQTDPDTGLSADEREIGGLGVFMVKKTMDDVWYAYEGGHNILGFKKYFGTVTTRKDAT